MEDSRVQVESQGEGMSASAPVCEMTKLEPKKPKNKEADEGRRLPPTAR
jgi:hypothetical protein